MEISSYHQHHHHHYLLVDTSMQTTTLQPSNGDLKTEICPNNRSKCQLCKLKIAKGCWRFQLGVAEMGHDRSIWQSAHTSCYFHNVTDGSTTRNSTQSMPYYANVPSTGWNDAPSLVFASSDLGEQVQAAITASDDEQDLPLDQLLPSADLRECFRHSVNASILGADALEGNHRIILEKFCFHKRLTASTEALLDESEAAEVHLHGEGYESKDPLKAKFVQYSPNSQAHCRDCQNRIEHGDVRVGANVFSSSSRHAGYSVNYWCLECMCARPATKRAARLYPDELGKILGGAELLAQSDVERVCNLLKIPLPSHEVLADMAEGRKRQTRSGRKFGNWGGDLGEEESPSVNTKRTRL